jgi:hypothetical protein
MIATHTRVCNCRPEHSFPIFPACRTRAVKGFLLHQTTEHIRSRRLVIPAASARTATCHVPHVGKNRSVPTLNQSKAHTILGVGGPLVPEHTSARAENGLYPHFASRQDRLECPTGLWAGPHIRTCAPSLEQLNNLLAISDHLACPLLVSIGS